MKSKELISLSFSGILVLCAVIITGLVIRQQFFPPKPEPQTRSVENWRQLDLQGPRSGPADAPVRIVEFFDYQCPFCKQVQPAVQAVMQKYPGRITLIHEHLPLSGHSYAFGAAVAAECAARQGHFQTYHTLLFARQDSLGALSYNTLAGEAAVPDTAAFARCVEEQQPAGIVRSGQALAEKLGITGIPTFLINGTLVSGALPEPQLENIVQDALAEVGN